VSQNHFRMLRMRIRKECGWRTDISAYRHDLPCYADEDSILWPTVLLSAYIIIICCGLMNFKFDNYIIGRSQWPRVPRRRSTAARLLRSWVRIPSVSMMSVYCECFFCQVEVSAASWSLVQRSPTDCGASCVIKNEETIARVGLQRHVKKTVVVTFTSIPLTHLQLICCKLL
jgi:hypothetical protein